MIECLLSGGGLGADVDILGGSDAPMPGNAAKMVGVLDDEEPLFLDDLPEEEADGGLMAAAAPCDSAVVVALGVAPEPVARTSGVKKKMVAKNPSRTERGILAILLIFVYLNFCM